MCITESLCRDIVNQLYFSFKKKSSGTCCGSGSRWEEQPGRVGRGCLEVGAVQKESKSLPYTPKSGFSLHSFSFSSR